MNTHPQHIAQNTPTACLALTACLTLTACFGHDAHTPQPLPLQPKPSPPSTTLYIDLGDHSAFYDHLDELLDKHIHSLRFKKFLNFYAEGLTGNMVGAMQSGLEAQTMNTDSIANRPFQPPDAYKDQDLYDVSPHTLNTHLTNLLYTYSNAYNLAQPAPSPNDADWILQGSIFYIGPHHAFLWQLRDTKSSKVLACGLTRTTYLTSIIPVSIHELLHALNNPSTCEIPPPR